MSNDKNTIWAVFGQNHFHEPDVLFSVWSTQSAADAEVLRLTGKHDRFTPLARPLNLDQQRDGIIYSAGDLPADLA